MSEKYHLTLKENVKDLHPAPFVVLSCYTFDMYNPNFVERWSTIEEAMICANNRQDKGYVVYVFQELAHSENVG